MLEHLILNGRIEAAYHYHNVATKNYKEELLSLFQKGKRKDFMKLFSLLKSEEKLQFYVRVYFLIYHIHPAIKGKPSIPEQQILAFRQYLDTKGAELAQTNQFLQFYALSFVKKPLEHPSYKALFKKEWVTNLTEKLNIFLANEDRRMKDATLKESDSKIMKSPDFGRQADKIEETVARRLNEENKVMHTDLQNFKHKYYELEKKYQALSQSFNTTFMETQHKWLQNIRQLTYNAKYLLDIISKSNSNLIHDRKYQRIKKKNQKFEKMAKKQLDQLLNQSQDLSVFDKPSNNEVSYSASATPNVSQRNITTFVMMDEFVPTNYEDLIRDFKKMIDTQKISVLQGLSWRIIKSKNKWVRRQTIIGLIVNDVLGLVNGDIQILLFNKNLMSHVLKLFLYISEDSYGRKVLFRNSGLYKELIDLIPETLKIKNYVCLDIILQILLNIWHSQEIFIELINLNIIYICINTLLTDENIIANDQLLESIANLLLNATAISEGLEALQNEVDVFYYLCQAFKEANDTNRNLIGAIMYALLGRRQLWKLAHQAKLPAFIQGLIQVDHRSNKQQLKLILAKLHQFQPGQTISSNDYNDEESIDSNLEQQNFQRNQDELNDLEEHIKGHDFLSAKYPLRSKKAEQQISEINKIMNQNRKAEEFPEAMTDGKRQNYPKEQKKQEKQSSVKLPQIKKKKQTVDIYNPRAKGKQTTEEKQYYSYKSPNFRQESSEKKNVVSMQAESFGHFREASQQRKKGNSFEKQPSDVKKKERVQTAKQQNSKQSMKKDEKRRQEKRSTQKQYRIKKSNSVEKGLGNPYKKQLAAYQTNKNASNAEYKSTQGVKSPPLKKNRDEVLRQLNQQLKAGFRPEQKQRRISSKHIIAQQNAQRENAQLKRNNYVATEEQLQAFKPKPRINRTPPKDDE